MMVFHRPSAISLAPWSGKMVDLPFQRNLEMTALGALELDSTGLHPPPKLTTLHGKSPSCFGKGIMQHLCCKGSISVAYTFIFLCIHSQYFGFLVC